MADKPTPPAAGAAQGLVITSYSTALPQACLSKDEAAAKKDPKEKKAKAGGTCTEAFSYYVQYPALAGKVAQGNLVIGADGKVKTVTVSPEGKRFLAEAKKQEIAKQFGDVVGYVSAWKKPVATALTAPEKSDKADKTARKAKKSEVLSGVLLGTELSDKVINFVVLGPASRTAGREIAIDLMQLDKRDLALKVLGNLKDQAGKATDPDHQAQKARVESLITQLTLASKADDALNKDTKGIKGELTALSRSVIATTISGLSYDAKESPLNFLKGKFDDFAKANSKGVTVFVNKNPLTESTIDPYQFLVDRLIKLKTEPAYQSSKPGELLEQAITFLNKAVKEKRINYITKSPTNAFAASLRDQIPANLSSLVQEELRRAGLNFDENAWKFWLDKKPETLSNLDRVVERVLEGFKGVTEGKIKVDLEEVDYAVRRSTIGSAPNTLETLANQRNLYLAAIGISRALLGNENSPKKTLKVWVAAKNDFEELPIDFSGSDQKIGGLAGVVSGWTSSFLIVGQVPAQAGKAPEAQVPPGGKAPATAQKVPVGPPAPTPAPAAEPPPSGVPLVPTTKNGTTMSPQAVVATHWSLLAGELVLAGIGTGLLVAGLKDSSAGADQGSFNLGNPTLIHTGGALLGAGVGGLGGRFTSFGIGRLQFPKPWTPFKSIVPDLVGMGVGALLGGLLPLARSSAVESATGGGNTGRNPGKEYGAIKILNLSGTF